jgi:glucosamine-6-phosphate deaminase
MTTLEKSTFNALEIHVATSRTQMGEYAAKDIAQEIRACLARQPLVRIVFAAAPSQAEMLAALCLEEGIDWSRVVAFHMDEYLGLPADAPQGFGMWLRDRLFDHLPFGEVNLLEGGADAERAADLYASKLNAAPIDIVCCGIGSNGHLAFNDPPAVFDDPRTVKIVELDMDCRQQQVDDDCFASIDEVPSRALTVSIPCLLAGRVIFCCVPGALKKEAVRRTLLEPVNPMCPATILREHPRCTLYLDTDSAGSDVVERYTSL